jgi:hypothetical protein
VIVRTASGAVYRVGEDTLCRMPYSPGSGLRQDFNTVPLFSIYQLKVGRPAIFFVEVVPGITTIRTTTPVVSIQEEE